MSRAATSGLITILLCAAGGCGILGKSHSGSLPGGVKSAGKDTFGTKQMAMGNGSTREPPLADPVPPPPPSMTVPEIPPAPAKEESLVIATPGSNSIVQATAIERARGLAEQPAESNLDSLRRLYNRAAEKFNSIEGFESKLTRRETVGTRAMPEEVLYYKFRKDPYSVHIKWIGKEAQNREIVYVEGRNDGKVQILTGKEPEFFRPSGIRVSRLPTDKDMTSKSRYDIRNGGLATAITWFGRVLAIMEKDPAQANRIRYIGPKPRRERETGLVAIEEMIPPGWEPQLPKGGRRTTHFDANPTSPSEGLPILIVTLDDTGREVEYYWFDEWKPAKYTDADFDADRLWRK